jgi:hypothetical protein
MYSAAWAAYNTAVVENSATHERPVAASTAVTSGGPKTPGVLAIVFPTALRMPLSGPAIST